ncbi:MAG: BMP family ABC transporter substrate-binding protein, partial [Sphaerochaeta sp.]|nr:BMP family ABC transporter substrate-binding protein [Sphaerochaeta sp.]
MKKFVGFIAMVLIAGLLFAAGSAEATSQEAGLNIAIITTPSGVDDGSFNQDNYNGILAFIDENPEAQVTAI